MSRCRKNIRLRGYDYSSDGLYYITICTAERRCYFGHVLNRVMVLNDIGKTAEKFWTEIPGHFPFVSLDNYIIMPNHVHGILIINHTPDHIYVNVKENPVGSCHGMTLPIIGNDPVRTRHGESLQITDDENVYSCHGETLQITGDDNSWIHHGMQTPEKPNNKNSRHNSINQFSKPIPGSLSVIVNQYKAAVKRWCNNNNHPEFCWQPRFYDCIINDPDEYIAFRNYIIDNPCKWENDDLYK
jgi:putative transposase